MRVLFAVDSDDPHAWYAELPCAPRVGDYVYRYVEKGDRYDSFITVKVGWSFNAYGGVVVEVDLKPAPTQE